MKLMLSGLICGLSIAIVFALSDDLEEWNAYKLKYGKIYRNQTEERTRMEIFLKNKHKIEDHNNKHIEGIVPYKMSLNKFSDLTPDEFNAQLKGIRPPDLLASTHNQNETKDYFVGWRHHKYHHHHYRHHHHHNYHHHHHPQQHHHRNISFEHLPDSIDWRTKGAVNGVAEKQQGMCGSCWAFSTTGAIEGQYFREHGKLIRLSEQSLIDCVGMGCGCFGCSLGEAYQFAEIIGVNTMDEYPTQYTEADGFCRFNSSHYIHITGHRWIPENDEDRLKEAIATIGPISLEIDAGHDSLTHYSSGIYYEPACSSVHLDHGVLAVGYGTDEHGQDYYILKNWWGKDWGENGYFKLARNRGNHCGVAKRAVFPLM